MPPSSADVSVEQYLAQQSDEVRAALEKIRRTVRSLVPDAEERISYGMPTFFAGKALLSYAERGKHCSIHPWSGTTLKAFRDDLKDFSTSAGTVRFTPDHPIPAPLLKRIITARLKEIHSGIPRPALRSAAIALPKLAAPAQRALAGVKIATLKDLRSWRETDVAELHGMGPNAMKTLRTAMTAAGFKFKRAPLNKKGRKV